MKLSCVVLQFFYLSSYVNAMSPKQPKEAKETTEPKQPKQPKLPKLPKLPKAPLPEAPIHDTEVWPPMFTQLAPQGSPLIYQPTTTSEATEMGWSKLNQTCDPMLGEAWLFGGEQDIDSSMTIFFTPEVAGTAGVASGLELDYYGYIEENLVGSYFSDEKIAKDGTYHSVAVALRDDDVCDTSAPKAPGNEPYFAVAPHMANIIIPTTENAPELSSKFKEGRCILTLGYHWVHDVVGGADLTYKAENLMPVIPMYSSRDGSINGIMFISTERKQVKDSNGDWKTNFWDKSPGLSEQINDPETSRQFCNNFCGTCQFSGSNDGYYTTLHWFTKDTQTPTSEDIEWCGIVGYSPGDFPFDCRNGIYP